MSPSRTEAGRRREVKAILALTAATACLGAVVAYAASRSSGGHEGLGEHHAVQQPADAGGPGAGSAPPSRERLLRPQLLEVPPESTTISDPQFRFHVPSRKPRAPLPAEPEGADEAPAETSTRRFQCRVDGGDWSACRSPYRLTGLTPGSHRFAVRVFNRENRAGEPAGFSWLIQTPPEPPRQPAQNPPAEPQQFSIEALREPEDLLPGFPPQSIPVRITNPNSVAIEVTEVTVAIGDAPADCPAENFELTPAGASPAEPVPVPPGSSVDLPAAGIEAPAIRMLDLPIEQDACQEAEIPLVFSGEARG